MKVSVLVSLVHMTYCVALPEIPPIPQLTEVEKEVPSQTQIITEPENDEGISRHFLSQFL